MKVTPYKTPKPQNATEYDACREKVTRPRPKGGRRRRKEDAMTIYDLLSYLDVETVNRTEKQKLMVPHVGVLILVFFMEQRTLAKRAKKKLCKRVSVLLRDPELFLQ